MDALIKQLAETWGPPGFEHRIRDMIRAEVEDVADEVYTDAFGNLICRVGSGDLRVMTAAHMDEIGLIVSHIDQQGYARFAMLGTLFPAALLGARVLFENGAMGVIGVEKQYSRRRELPPLAGFYIDLSASGVGENTVNVPVGVGDPGAIIGTTIRRENRLIGKSLDNRVGCAIQIAALRRVAEQGTPHSVYFVFTVQEEVGVRGAGPATFGVEPHLAFAIDGTNADQPLGKRTNVQLGAGAAIKARDYGLIVPAAVRDLLIQRAEEANIPYQMDVIEGASTDGKAIQNVKIGVPTGGLSYPMRYTHTPSEIVDLGDVAAVTDLLVATLTGEIVLG